MARGRNARRSAKRESADTTKGTSNRLLETLFARHQWMKWFARFFGSTAAQQAAGRKNPKERLVRHGGTPVPRDQSLKRALRALWRMVFAWLVLLSPLIAYLLFRDPTQHFSAYIQDHLTLLLIPAVPITAVLVYSGRNHMRTNPPQQKGKPRRRPKPPLPPSRQRIKDIDDILANLDHLPARLVWWALIVMAAVLAGRDGKYALSVDTIRTLADTQDQAGIQTAAVAVLIPIAALIVPHLRAAYIIRQRFQEIEECYDIAKPILGYKDTKGGAETKITAEQVPWLAIDVKKWWALYEIDIAFVLAPTTLHSGKMGVWDDLAADLTVKLPRPEEWRVRRDEKGRGAFIGAANYPTGVLWDGDIEDDPLTFWIGINLETGEREVLTFSAVSPHMALSGGTSSGKTSLAEVIAVQVLVKPMPWDPSLYGRVVIVDPKGPFAQRWCGRPGVVVVDGSSDAPEPDEEGRPVTGPILMSECINWVEEEHRRRAAVLAKFPDVATWVDLPNEVKAEEKFVPIFVILDEYIDHVAIDKPGPDATETEEREYMAARHIQRMAGWHLRKYRNVGMHTILIGQELKMTGPTGIGSAHMRNMPVRGVTGQMDPSQLGTIFGQDTEVPAIPSAKTVVENGERRVKTIPGRARVMNAGGQAIYKIQVPYFGGDYNADTLNKWLPRGPKPVNGDFTIPDIPPRKPEDFDEDGEYIGTDETPVVEDPKADGAKQIALEKHPRTDTTTTAPSDEDGPAEEEDDEGEFTPPDFPSGEPLTDGDDETAVFPAANRAPKVCEMDDCVEDADSKCGECGKVICEEHRRTAPDPEDGGPVCETDYDRDPLVVAGLTDLYSYTYKQIAKTSLQLEYDLSDENSVIATLRTGSGRKALQIMGTPGKEPKARSSSGQVEGTKPVRDRIRTVVSNLKESGA